MHGLVSLLDPYHYNKVEEIWQMLGQECGLAGIRVTPYPHFSWLIAEDFDWIIVESIMTTISRQTAPFQVHASGLGIFTGPEPVIFIPVFRSDELIRFHKKVWDAVLPTAKNASDYYSPAAWTPHISLAYSDVTPKNIGCLSNILAFRPINWDIRVDNLTLIYEPAGQIGTLKYHKEFSLEEL